MPHGYVCETPVHIVYRLAGCLPVGVLKELTKELVDQLEVLRKQHPPSLDRIAAVKEEYFLQYDALLDAQDQSKYILKDIAAIQIVLDSWKMLHAKGDCQVIAVCVMGNHVHVILRAWPGQPEVKLGLLVGRHKRFTNRALKQVGYLPLGGQSTILAEGFFDRYVRPGTFEVVFAYVLDNPVKAGLVGHARMWKGLWVP